MIEIDEPDAQILQMIVETGCDEQVLDVAAMTRPLAHDDLPRAGPEKRRCRTRNEQGIRVDHGAGVVLDEIGLQQHAAAPHVWPENLKAARDDIPEVDAIVGRRKQPDDGTGWQAELLDPIGRPAARASEGDRHRQRAEELAPRQFILIHTLNAEAGCCPAVKL